MSESPYHELKMRSRTFELLNAKEHTAADEPRADLLLEPGEGEWYSNVYDACVATGDYWIGALLDELDASGLSDNTIVAYTSDHGEELLDHGLLNHAHALWQELVHVPLVIAGPGIPRGERVRAPVSNRHLAPTLARRAGVSPAFAGDAFDLLADGGLPERPVFFDTRHGWWKGRQFVPLMGVRDGDWVLHWSPEGKPWDAPDSADPGEGEARLFDLYSDPGEQNDRASEEPERVERLREMTIRERARHAEEQPARKLRAGAATLDLLRAAGYAGDDE